MAKKKFRIPRIYLLSILPLVAFLGFFIVRKAIADTRCANSLSCEESLEFSVNNEEMAVYDGVEIDPPDIDLLAESQSPAVLGTETESGAEKRIDVDLTTQTLYAYEGDKLFMQAKVATGKLYPTPTGEFTIWRKIRSTKMSGGSGAGYYYLPNVPYVMFFSNAQIAAGRGFSIHGTYWHNNFGHPMSHGCVNMRTIDVEKLFNWADPALSENQKWSTPGVLGTKIKIYGEAP